MTSILSAKHRASRWPALLEISLAATLTKSKQCQGKKPDSNAWRLKRWAQASPILVILHYLLKNNTWDFNTKGDSKKAGGAPRCVLAGICDGPSHCEAIV